MLAIVQLTLTALLAALLQDRVCLLRNLRGLPRYLASLGLTLFLVNWANFIGYVLFGWGRDYLAFSWLTLLIAVGVPLIHDGMRHRRPLALLMQALGRDLRAFPKWNGWFLALSLLVLTRFFWGLESIDGTIWSNFNFLDTAFHLSIANAFLVAPHFPPMDLDMAPFPLKYHFLADFYVAHLHRLGLQPLHALWLMNMISATTMLGTLWATFERWLRLPRSWVFLAILLFLFLNTALVNVLHYLSFRSPFFDPSRPFDGLFAFPFYNFEWILSNLIEPQRSLPFTLPVVLLILHAAFGNAPRESGTIMATSRHFGLLQAFILVCLLPFSHVVAFAVLAASLAPVVWTHRAFLWRWWVWWTPALALGVLQLLYLFAYGPPPNESFDSWDALRLLPANELAGYPQVIRRIVFWLLANGDFLFWGGLFTLLAALRAGSGADGLRRFLSRWKWYFAACSAFFLLINFYRYAFDWGDSNKFVLFLNLGLSLVIALGAAQWRAGRLAVLSRALWWFFASLCVAPHAYEFYRDVFVYPQAKVALFQQNGQVAAAWLRIHAAPTDLVLTGASNSFHFVTALAGRPTLTGLYGNTNPYRQDARREQIRRVYEDADFSFLDQLGVRFVCLSRAERRRYKIHPRWTELMEDGRAVVFRAGRVDEFDGVFIFDARLLSAGPLGQ